jgi:apolipoprotein N-acyltransferase
MGESLNSLAWSQQSIIVAALTNALQHLTPYARLGGRVLLGLLLVAVAAATCIWAITMGDRFGRDVLKPGQIVHDSGPLLIAVMSV